MTIHTATLPETEDDQQAAQAPGCSVFSKKYRTTYDETGLTLTASYQTVFSYTGSGKLAGFVVEFTKSTPKFKLTIDGSEVIWELTSDNIQDIEISSGGKLSETGGGPIWDNNGSKLYFKPDCPIAYATSYELEALREVSTPDVTRFIHTSTRET